ncbi:LbetaH domain-containing protein [Flavobacterium fluviale]|uniref:Acetyltransferase n=1 Tax=Flavobacterium fluviale TaxID=2249356 RepID=A0A344LN83_9FLAO|nr:acetyltransferase [Flavobacterium fluviale]AXB55375.1 acetyltransferase [Flavobacterium fluviale]
MRNSYTVLGKIKLAFWLIRTKFIWWNARIIRFPFDLRGKRYMQISKGFTTGVGCRLEAYPNEDIKVLFIGENVQINDYVHISANQNVSIGNNVLIASKVFISDLNHGSYGNNEIHDSPETPPNSRKLYSNSVIIEDNVWLGEFVSVLSGVTIGRGTIVGAGSVVSKSLPNHVIAVGAPAKVIKKYNFDSKKWEKHYNER